MLALVLAFMLALLVKTRLQEALLEFRHFTFLSDHTGNQKS